MTKAVDFSVDGSGRWSGGGTAFLNNVAHAERRHSVLRGGPEAVQIIPRNVPTRTTKLQRPFILAPQNAWPWKPSFVGFMEFRRVAALRVASAYYMRRAAAVLRISGAIPAFSQKCSPVIHNVLDTGFETDFACAETTRISAAEGSFVSLGSMNSYRNIANLLLGYRKYRAAGGKRDILIAGAAGPPQVQKKIERLARSTSGVHIRSQNLGRSECLAAMRSAAAVVLPSRVEASPVTALEAVACSAHVTASRIVGHREILGEYGPVPKQALFDPQSPDDIARKLADSEEALFADSHRRLANPGLREQARVDWGNRVADWLVGLGGLEPGRSGGLLRPGRAP